MSPFPAPEHHVPLFAEESVAELPDAGATEGVSRRGFLGYVLAGSTLAVAAQVGLDAAAPAHAAAATEPAPLFSPPQIFDAYDLSDAIRDACRPTNHLLRIEIGRDGFAHFDLPRAEVGQGITTAIAMIIAEELDLPLNQVKVTLADARPELIFNQITGGSSTLYSLYEPVRAAAAFARQRLVAAAGARWGVPAATLRVRDGGVDGPDGARAMYGSLTEAAASATTQTHELVLEAPAGKVVGTRQRRLDARAAVTGRKLFAMDLKVPGALPTMVCRPPTLKGGVRQVLNREQVLTMPGVTHVAPIPTGVAVRARTFGQCIDAVRALKVEWTPGPVAEESNESIREKLAANEIPLPPALPGSQVVEEVFTFHPRSGSPLETNTAVADVRSDRAEVWSSLKFPIITKQQIAERLELPLEAVQVHVVEGGGSFGRRLFSDAAYEAVEASVAFGAPVKLMWHRTDDNRHGRMHGMALSRVRMTISGNTVTSYDQRHTGVTTDFTHGLGESITGRASEQNHYGHLGVATTIFQLTTGVPYDFGVTAQLLNEIFEYNDFPTSSVRHIYSPDTATARELMVDRAAEVMKMDPVEFRLGFIKSLDLEENIGERLRAVLRRCAEVGQWGRTMPAGTGQGIAIHHEYKAPIAVLTEIDCRPETVRRKVPNAYTGPRVTKVVVAVDVGLPINPLGLEAQMLGGAMDGIAQALTAGLHIREGLPLEGSWDDYRYLRQWNAPLEFRCEIMPPTTGYPAGAGELACGTTQASVACAYARATGRMPTEFPINFHEPVGFAVKPKVPPIPQSPTTGLSSAGRDD